MALLERLPSCGAARSGFGAVLAALVFAACGPTPSSSTSVDPPSETDAAVCDESSDAPGCLCEGEATRSCSLAPLGEGDDTLCRVGTLRCRSGRWSACEDVEVLTPQEVSDRFYASLGTPGRAVAALVTGPTQCSLCEPACRTYSDRPGPRDIPGRGMDVEFDPGRGGVALEGTPTMCSSPDCEVREEHGAGSANPWMPDDTNSEGVTVDMDGALTLGVTTSSAPGVWIASMDDGTVSRLDPTTGREIARYATARPDFVNGARPWNEACNWSNRGNCPSRTAVDQNFDAYVANRAFGNQGTLTKIAARLTDCRDRNGDGIIQTSSDVNGDGIINRTIGAGEFFGPSDECILWTVPVGPNNGVPRALAVGIAPPGRRVGDLWVGLYNSQISCRLDPDTGAARGCVSHSGMRPYGGASDDLGRIWLSTISGGTGSGGQTLAGRIDPSTMTYAHASRSPAYVSAYGNGIWISPDFATRYMFIGGLYSEHIVRYNINTNTWNSWSTSAWNLHPRGVAADEEYLWASTYCRDGDPGSTLMQYRISDMALIRRFAMGSTGCHSGVGVGFDGAVWVVSGSGSRAARLSPDRATQIATPSLFVSPYTYSDFIGFGLNVFAEPRGYHRFTVDAGSCTNYRWSSLEVDFERPAGTTVEFYVRTGNTTAEVGRAAWIGPFIGNPRTDSLDLTVGPGPVPSGRYIEVEVRMETTNRSISPRVFSTEPVGYCDYVLYDPVGSYRQVYDGSSECMGTLAPDWDDLTWNVVTPPGTRIEFEIRVADTAAGVAAATPYIITVPPTSPPVDIDDFIRSRGGTTNLYHASVTAVLYSTPDRRVSPTLFEFGVEYTCEPLE